MKDNYILVEFKMYFLYSPVHSAHLVPLLLNYLDLDTVLFTF